MRSKNAHSHNHTGLMSNSSHCSRVQHRTSAFSGNNFAIWSALCATIFPPQMFLGLHQFAEVNPKIRLLYRLSSANLLLSKTSSGKKNLLLLGKIQIEKVLLCFLKLYNKDISKTLSVFLSSFLWEQSPCFLWSDNERDSTKFFSELDVKIKNLC